MIKHYNKQSIQNLDRIFRLNLINSISGVRPVNLIGTVNSQGQPNLAVFSSVTHLGSDPALFGLILRPSVEVPRHTYENILETQHFTINQVHTEIIDSSHKTSAKFLREESEFYHCDFEEEWLNDFKAPYVKQSHLKFGLRFKDDVLIKHNQTRLVIGEVEDIYLPASSLSDEGYIDSASINTTGVVGLNNYYQLSHISTKPYAYRKHSLK